MLDCIAVQQAFETCLSLTGSEIRDHDQLNRPGWSNRAWSSDLYRIAHVNVVDVRDSKGLWMMHCCIFPHLTSSAPIFGFDVFAGKTKITGCFHDFSPTTDPNHPLIQWFANESRSYQWKRTRELPQWAKEIFSDHMIAVGNVQTDDELEKITEIAIRNINYYLNNLSKSSIIVNSMKQQNFYCSNQKQNPHNPRVLGSLGLSEQEVNLFINNYMFPEI